MSLANLVRFEQAVKKKVERLNVNKNRENKKTYLSNVNSLKLFSLYLTINYVSIVKQIIQCQTILCLKLLKLYLKCVFHKRYYKSERGLSAFIGPTILKTKLLNPYDHLWSDRSCNTRLNQNVSALSNSIVNKNLLKTKLIFKNIDN